MNLQYGVVLKTTGTVMMVIGLSMLPSFFVCVFAGDSADIKLPFILSIAVVSLLGYTLRYAFRYARADLKLRDGFLLVAVCWIAASVTGAVPYIATGVLSDPFDAFFESVSGFSTTGASVIDDVESLPVGILFWRSFTQWIGGIGILVFAIGLMPSLGISGQNVMSPVTPNISLGKITTKMSDVVKTLYVTYFFFTGAEIIMLKLAGMSLFDAFVHTFSCVGTGGFTAYNDGISHFQSPAIYLVLMLFMLICGINFNLYFMSLRHGFSRLFGDIEFRFYISTIVVITMLMTMGLIAAGTDVFTDALLDGAFQTISIISTTGFTTADYTTWPYFCQMILLCLMFVGGCSSSTSGGVKAIRIVVIIKYIAYGIHNRLHPNSVEPIKINGQTVPPDTVSGVTYHILLYIVMMFAGSFILSLENISMADSFSSVITCMGNIGPAFGDIGTLGTFADHSWLSKLTLSAEMLAGRLELYTLFIIFTPRFWNPNN